MYDTSELEKYNAIIFPKSFEIPQRSRLYSLEPIGTGTSHTESLSSYLTRLAQEHCVTPKKLVMGEIAPLIMGDRYQSPMISKNVSIIFGNSDAKPGVNGMREMTRSLILALEHLTLRQDLQYLSCLTYQGIIKKRGLFRQHKAWCHQCFEEWQQENKPIYEPLLWSFKDVYYCLKHNCQLCDRCPNCDSQQRAIADFCVLGYCSRCRHWLGKSDRTESSLPEDSQKNYFIVQGIGDLIAFTPQLDIE